MGDITGSGYNKSKDIAIIGIAAKFPMAENVEEFWNNIRNGMECTGPFPEYRRRDTDHYLHYINKDINKVKYVHGAYFDEIDKFDYKFFNLSPREANLMDPNQRMFLETALEAIEDAGYGGKKLNGNRTGVYIGFRADKQVYREAVTNIDSSLQDIAFTGNTAAIIPSRVSYILNLKGPALMVDTACSSAFVALHIACQALKDGDCEMAVVGGISIIIMPLDGGYKIGIESSDSKTRTFDNNSTGTNPGEGVIAILIKPLEKAREDRDNIYSVIKSTAVNHDGKSIGITAPNSDAQEDVILRAWEAAGIHPETISYIEAHGTGTKLGDPTEILGIKQAFKRYTNKYQFCAIGSVKTNIGHLNSAAGLAGLVKVLMAMKYKKLPPSINFKKPNFRISFHRSPIYVNDMLNEWETANTPRRSGINSFGISGTNCHVVLEEAPKNLLNKKECDKNLNIFTLSAKNKNVLLNLIDKYLKYFEKSLISDISDICYTANTGRGHYEYRIAMLVKSWHDLKAKIEKLHAYDFNISEIEGIYFGDQILSTIMNNTEKNKPGAAKLKDFLNIDANSIIRKYIENPDNENLLKDLCKMYVTGADINWDQLYEGGKYMRVSLPTYAFERIRCWMDIPDMIELQNSINLYYVLDWHYKLLDLNHIEIENGTLLILRNNNSKCEEIVQRLTEQGNEIIDVKIGDEFRKINERCYIVGNAENDYYRLLLEFKGKKLKRIIHLSTLTGIHEVKTLQELDNSQKWGIYSLLYLVKAIIQNGINENVDVVLLSEYVNEVVGDEKVIPENATIFGLGKVIAWEHPRLKCRCIDIDEATMIDHIIQEINTGSKDYIVAFRNNSRYIEVLKEFNISNAKNLDFHVKENGIYIITGGTGGIGLEISKFLASKGKVNLALVNRSIMPPRKDWDDILKSKQNESLIKKIRYIREIEYMGAKVNCYKTDVTDYDQVKALIYKLKLKYGTINGIIHGATSGEGKLILDLDEKNLQDFLSVKVKGTWIIDRVTREEDMDFLIIFSSAITLMGGTGSGCYTAANSYLDSFAAYRRGNGQRTFTVNWPTWSNTGMTAGKKIDESKELFKILLVDRAINAFSNLISKDIKRVVIGELNYESNIFELEEYLPFALSEELRVQINRNKSREILRVENEKSADVRMEGGNGESYTATEMQVGQIIGGFLGFKKINIYDNFYELGLDSIIATRVVNRINNKMSIKVSIADLFNNLTIKAFSGCIDKVYLGIRNKTDIYGQIQPIEKRDFYPVSSAQKRMFVLNKLEGNSTAYNLTESILIEGKISKDRLENAFNALIRRHEVLRTSFEFIDGEVVQIVHKNLEIEIEYVKLKFIEEQYIKDIANKFIKHFDLAKLPLLRVILIETDDDRYILLYDMHHILLDGRSRSILIHELISLYEGYELPDLKRQYKDFSHWQNNLLKSDIIKEQENYWLNKFKGEFHPLNLPTDYDRPPVNTFEGDVVVFKLNEALTKKLKRYVLGADTTLYMVLLTAFYVILYKYTGQEDIVIGSAIEGRPHVDLENIIGIFVNSLAMRNYPSGEKTFRQFLEEVKGNALKAYENQDYQFEELIEKLRIPRNPNRNPLFDIAFVLQNQDRKEIQINNIKFLPYQLASISSRFDLALDATEINGEIIFYLYYYIKIFKESTVKKFSDGYLKILEAILTNKEIYIKDINILSDSEKQQIISKVEISENAIQIDFDIE